MTVGKRITTLRKQSGFSRISFAERLDIPQTTLRNYETDSREPGHSFLLRMAKEFNVSTDFILGLTDDPTPYAVSDPTSLDALEYPVMAKYRRLTPTEQNRIDIMIDRVLSGQSITENATTQKKPAPTNEGELDKAIIDMMLQLQLSPYELQRLVDFAKGLAAARTEPLSDKYSDR